LRFDVPESSHIAKEFQTGRGQAGAANYETQIFRKPQIPLAFVRQESNGRDVLTGAQAPGGETADKMIGEFFGPARLVAGSGLAVVTATAPPKPRG
jgi:hypothetical protein